jgi:hypothetical protein
MTLVLIMYPKKKGLRGTFFEEFEGQIEMRTPKLTRKIAKATFYGIILPEIDKLNRGINKVFPGLKIFIIEKVPDMEGRIHTIVRRNPKVMISSDEDFHYFRIEDAGNDEKIKSEQATIPVRGQGFTGQSRG